MAKRFRRQNFVSCSRYMQSLLFFFLQQECFFFSFYFFSFTKGKKEEILY